MREIILVCYLLCIILGVSGLTVALITKNRQQSDINRALIWFFTGMLITCFYDMAIYYCDYSIGALGALKTLRIGNCIISGVMLLWLRLQKSIVKKDALIMLETITRRYIAFYVAMWLMITCFLGIEQFHTLKWMLLMTDAVLIVLVITAAAGYTVYAAAAGDKRTFGYMTAVTAMLVWNYMSYFLGEISAYWENSGIIRAPLDLTIVFWFAVNAGTVLYGYKRNFLNVFVMPAGGHMPEENGDGSDAGEKIERLCIRYKITPREKEFVELIYSGKNNEEIAESLFLSESTVKTHVYNIFRKLDVNNRVGLICLINGDTAPDKNTAEKQRQS